MAKNKHYRNKVRIKFTFLFCLIGLFLNAQINNITNIKKVIVNCETAIVKEDSILKFNNNRLELNDNFISTLKNINKNANKNKAYSITLEIYKLDSNSNLKLNRSNIDSLVKKLNLLNLKQFYFKSSKQYNYAESVIEAYQYSNMLVHEGIIFVVKGYSRKQIKHLKRKGTHTTSSRAPTR